MKCLRRRREFFFETLIDFCVEITGFLLTTHTYGHSNVFVTDLLIVPWRTALRELSFSELLLDTPIGSSMRILPVTCK